MEKIKLYSDIDGTMNISPFTFLQQLPSTSNLEEIKRSSKFIDMLINAPVSKFFNEIFKELYVIAIEVIYHSGRNLYHKIITEKWLAKNGVFEKQKCKLKLFPFDNRQHYLDRKYNFLEREIRTNEKSEIPADLRIFDDDQTLVEWLQDYIEDIDIKFSKVILVKNE